MISSNEISSRNMALFRIFVAGADQPFQDVEAATLQEAVQQTGGEVTSAAVQRGVEGTGLPSFQVIPDLQAALETGIVEQQFQTLAAQTPTEQQAQQLAGLQVGQQVATTVAQVPVPTTGIGGAVTIPAPTDREPTEGGPVLTQLQAAIQQPTPEAPTEQRTAEAILGLFSPTPTREQQNVSGAVRVTGNPTVFTLGPGGGPIASPEDLLAKGFREDEVIEISPEEARTLGIDVDALEGITGPPRVEEPAAVPTAPALTTEPTVETTPEGAVAPAAQPKDVYTQAPTPDQTEGRQFTSIRDIYDARPDLQTAFPGGATGPNADNLNEWWNRTGRFEYPNVTLLAPDDYRLTPGLQDDFEFDPINAFKELYKRVYDETGVGALSDDITKAQDDLEALDDKFADKIQSINDNPWISEGLRVSQIKSEQDKHELKRAQLVSRLALFEGFMESARQEARFIASGALGAFQAQRAFEQEQLEFLSDQAQREFDNAIIVQELGLAQRRELRLGEPSVTRDVLAEGEIASPEVLSFANRIIAGTIDASNVPAAIRGEVLLAVDKLLLRQVREDIQLQGDSFATKNELLDALVGLYPEISRTKISEEIDNSGIFLQSRVARQPEPEAQSFFDRLFGIFRR